MQFRIGINLGDVVEEENRLYSDGFSLAACLESMAEGCGICISGSVFSGKDRLIWVKSVMT
jgi:class 3 adenylate cyclase